NVCKCSSYSCYCADGYTGTNCQTEWDECWSQPCLNGGDCFDLVANYNCSCPEGFSGLSCEIDRDECLSEPCQNNGTCVDGSNGFRCDCLPGYTGSVCEWDISVCNETGTERCLNGGACVEGPGERFWCICAPGWGGAICEEALDPCLILQPCMHGGLCLPRGSEFICACPFGFSGERCELELSLCKENTCLNGAICIEEGGTSVCYCVPDFHGDLCQYQYDECLLPPTPSCKNGGTCVDGVDGFSCSCPSDVTGKYCECPIGQDCTNLTYFPSLPTTESHSDELSTTKLTSTLGEGTTSPKSTILTSTHDTISEFFTSHTAKSTRTSTKFLSSTTDSNREETLDEETIDAGSTSSVSQIFLTTEVTVSLPVDLMPKFSSPSTFSDSYIKFSDETQSGFLLTTELDVDSLPSKDENLVSMGTTEIWDYSKFTEIEDASKAKDLPSSTESVNNEVNATVGLNTPLEDRQVQSSTLEINVDAVTTEGVAPLSSPMSEPSLPTFFTNINNMEETSSEISLLPGATIAADDRDKTNLTEMQVTSMEPSDSSVSGIMTSSIDNFEKNNFVTSYVSSSSLSIQDSITELSAPDVLSTSAQETSASFSLTSVSSTGGFNELSNTSDSALISTINEREFSTLTDSSIREIYTEPSSSPAIISRTTPETTHSNSSKPAIPSKTSPLPTSVSVSENFTDDGILDFHETQSFPWTTSAVDSSEVPDYGPPTSDYGDATEAELKKCKTESPCLNGGVCYSVGTNIQCRCPFQFTGLFCDVPTNYSEVSLLPTSWLLFRVVSGVNRKSSEFSHSFEATVRIVSEEGVVFTLAEADEGPMSNYFMQMSIYRGRLQLQFSCGLQSVKFSESKLRVDTGKPTKIHASLSMWVLNNITRTGRCRAELKLNHSLAVSGEQTRPYMSKKKDTALAHLVFGSWPRVETSKHSEEDEIYSERISTSPGVVACLSDVKVNEKSKILLADVTTGSNDVSECVQLACLSNPCQYGGTCEETPSNSWTCRCPSGRLGPRCETSVCENSPCQAGGTCLMHPGTNFVCLCPMGREGVFCENEHLITKPCFFPTFVDINPFMAVPLLPRHESFKQAVEMSVRFTPMRTHQVALLAYIGHGPKDHMALGYVHGRIILTWDLGSGPRRIFTAKEFPSGSEYEVRFGRSGKEGWLSVKGDNMTHSGYSIGKMIQLNTRPFAYFGGFDDGNTSILPHDLPKHSGFEGCLSHIEIKTAQSQVTKYFPPGSPNSPVKGRSVMQQDYNPCTKNPCRQGGICLPHGPSFTCLCAQGWFGPLCAEPRNPCDTQRNMCAEGSTCVPLQFGYECDCPLGKTGRFCNSIESRNSVVWPELYFTGKRSFLEIPRSMPLYSDPGLMEHSCVEFEMKPQAWTGPPAAQVLFFSQDPDTGDFMTLLLTADRVLELIIGTGDEAPMILSSPRSISIRAGVWMKVRAGRVGRRVFLSVAGRSVSNWLLPGQSSNWNGGHATLYIGGASDMSLVAPVTWLLIRPYSGCLRKLHVDWRKVIVHLGRARLNLRGVRTVGNEPHKFRHQVAQLSPEYIRQVQLTKNSFVPNLGDEIISLLGGKIMASYVAKVVNMDFTPESNTKKGIQLHSLRKSDFNRNTNIRRAKDFNMSSLSSNKTANEEIDDLNDIESSTQETEITLNLDNITPPGIMTKNLRTRDALFVMGARNVRPCDKSALALLQLDPCTESQSELNCLSQPLKAKSSASMPEFRGNGYITFEAPLLMSDDTEVSPVRYLNVEFSTKSNKGLIVWIDEKSDVNAFVGLGLIDGRLQVVWGNEKNSSTTAIISGLINNGLFHRVTILWDSAEKSVVWLDGEMGDLESDWKRQKRQFSNKVKTTLTFIVGGFPNNHPTANSIARFFDSTFQGCVSELGWNDETAQLSEYATYHHNNVFSCNSS
ncbi:protein eyes shut-like, partial [Neocloeon triangulifer]|uniref:protein eyes shut-like n=1 Tax=Neocloeon triangulifer TaxID=2078957 RepID=UPI00286F4239